MTTNASEPVEDAQGRPAPPPATGFVPPRRLSTDRSSRHWHPSVNRVGVRIDGEEVSDCTFYCQDRLEYRRRRGPYGIQKAETIEPYVRDDRVESRQERRARERWEAKRNK